MLLFRQIYKKSWKNQGFFRLFTERDCARQRSCLRIPLPAGGVLAKLDGIRLICILLFFVRTSLRSSFASIEWFSLLKASFQCSNRSLSAASALPVHKKKWMQFFASTLRRERIMNLNLQYLKIQWFTNQYTSRGNDLGTNFKYFSSVLVLCLSAYILGSKVQRILDICKWLIYKL